eukprot:SAG31_NODE_4037_length_3644_cov_2.637800_2_plen_482_part_00
MDASCANWPRRYQSIVVMGRERLRSGMERLRSIRVDWLCPTLRHTKKPGQQLTNWIKKVEKQVSLPPKPSAAGIRPGTINTLCSLAPTDLVVQTTGHDLRGASAVYEYLTPLRSVLMAGATILAGWPAPPWGQHGCGPSPPDFSAIIDRHQITSDEFERFVSSMFFVDGTTEPKFQRNGSQRQILHWCLASQVMYHTERKTHGEARRIVEKLTNTLATVKNLSFFGAESLLDVWASTLREKFDADNLRVRLGNQVPAAAFSPIFDAYEGLRKQNEELMRQLKQLRTEVALQNRPHTQEANPSTNVKSKLPAIEPPGKRRREEPSASSHQLLLASSNRGQNFVGQESVQRGARSHYFMSVQIPPQAPNVAKQTRNKIIKVNLFFDAMATRQEKNVLQQRGGHPDVGKVLRLLDHLLCEYGKHVCQAASIKPPRSLHVPLKATTLYKVFYETKGIKGRFNIVNETEVQQYRRQHHAHTLKASA